MDIDTRILGRTAALLTLALLAGCGLSVQQQAAISRFSTATSEFSTVSRSEFQQSRSDVIEMNRRRRQLGDDSVAVTELDGHFTIDRTTTRLAAIDALQEYSQLLGTLVSTTPPSEVKAATDSFVASLRKVPGVSLSDSEAGAIGRVVVFGGTLFIEYKRKKAVQEVVEIAHPHILSIIDLVKQDFDPDSDLWNAGYRQVTLDLRGAAQAARPRAASGDLPAQALIAGSVELAEENAGRFASICAQITQTADRLREAQQNLRYAVHSNEITSQDIDNYVAQVNELAAIYSLLRTR